MEQAQLNEIVKRGGMREIEDEFRNTILMYLKSIGLFETGHNWPKTDFRPKDNTMNVSCEGVKIFPEEKGREHILDGFRPNLTFFLNPDDSTEIEVFSKIKEEGCELSPLLIPTRILCYLSTPKDDYPPIIEKIAVGEITIAGVDKISFFLEQMKTVAQVLGEEGWQKLGDEEERINKVPPEYREQANDKYARTILKVLGVTI